MYRKIARRSLVAIVAVGAAWAHAAVAAPPLALSVKGGTMGYGLEATCGLTQKLNVRAGFNPGPSYSYSFSAEEIAYDVSVEFRSLSALLDWHPGAGPFHLSTGVFMNHNRWTGEAAPGGSYLINGVEYSGADVGSLSMDVGFSKLAPYMGLGWGNAVGRGSRIGVVFDAGVILMGSPSAKLGASGPLANDELLSADLAAEQERLNDTLKLIKVYPVMSLGLRFRF